MKKSYPHSLGSTRRQNSPGRPSSLTKTEEQRYVTLRNWGFSQRESGALARNPPRGRNGTRLLLGGSTCQRLDKLHGPFAETLRLSSSHNADSLRKLPERALAALADAHGDVNNRKYQEAIGTRAVVKRAKRAKKPAPTPAEQHPKAKPREALPDESATYRAWHRASFVLIAFDMRPQATLTERLKDARDWCLEMSSPVELDAGARRHLTPWEQIAATWDGEFIADAARETLLLPFRDESHPNITPASQEAILSARNFLQSKRPQSSRKFNLLPFNPDDEGDEWLGDMRHH